MPFLQRSRRIPAVVEYVLSGHRFKVLIPKETCSIAFSFSGVRCPGRNERYSNEALLLMRQKILQRDVEVLHFFKYSRLLSILSLIYIYLFLYRLKWKQLIEPALSWDLYGSQGPTWQ